MALENPHRRRQVLEDKLSSKHESLEQEHRGISEALSELIAEACFLKNMFMAHGSCDCQLIQDESALDWVAGWPKS